MKSYHRLRKQLNLLDDIPFTPDWSAAADFIQLIVDDCLNKKPKMIVECSSGLTTLMLARCCQINKQGHVYSLENGKEYADKTQQYIKKYQLENYATIIHAPLQTVKIDQSEYLWYELEQLPEKSINMLVIDGPPGYIQDHSRYPAIPLLYHRLSDQCRIFLDDAAREDEKELVSWWRKKYTALNDEYQELERGCTILTMQK